MKTGSAFSKADLDNLLRWLSADVEESGRKYLEIREGLVRYFRTKGCYESQSLADETINRGGIKLKTLNVSGDVKPSTYFYGFAKNIFFEYSAELRKTPVQLESTLVRKLGNGTAKEDKEPRFLCLDDCMAKLKKDDSEMMSAYFSKDRSQKVEFRRRLAESMNLTMGNLHIKVHRLKKVLRECVENCLEKA